MLKCRNIETAEMQKLIKLDTSLLIYFSKFPWKLFLHAVFLIETMMTMLGMNSTKAKIAFRLRILKSNSCVVVKLGAMVQKGSGIFI